MLQPLQVNNVVEMLGAKLLGSLHYVGGMSLLLVDTLRWGLRSAASPRLRDIQALSQQVIRLGVKSIGIVVLVQLFIGVILGLQMSPPLEDYGQEGQVSAIIGVAGFRMLGPILTGVVLSGFAGASIAAELGTMVVSEEIEAMEAMALNPVRFLVLPRILGTIIVMLLLTPLADMMIALGGYLISWMVLGPTVYVEYWSLMRDTLEYSDFFTGLAQAGVFGVLISLVACYEGLGVRGGAEGVGRATTMTVVYSIVAIILAACACTVIFYVFGL
ncbi:MAG TPA: ABC transporter permease [Phycisphaerae bacterium]|nr:ABC transporter permease [Phycisphaerae bacterium]